MANLFDPIQIRGVSLKNRIAVSPMCQYSAQDGMTSEWHLVHLGSRAVGGAALVIFEAAAVNPAGRISLGDAGIWNDEQVEPLLRMNRFIKKQNAVPGIQLAHAGRKASLARPWETKQRIQNGIKEMLSPAEGAWEVLAPSAIPFSPTYPSPREMTREEIAKTVSEFRAAAERALKAEFQWIEIHAAHGYLLNTFLSPLSNQRKDSYGGSFDNRIRILLETVGAIREVWPEKYPLAVRISATDWAEEGWSIEDSISLSKILKTSGVDLIDCSSGGLIPTVRIPVGPGYQVPFAEQVKREAQILTGAVGMITEAKQAQAIIQEGKADLVFLARALLKDPYWPLHAAEELGVSVKIPEQYERGFVRKK